MKVFLTLLVSVAGVLGPIAGYIFHPGIYTQISGDKNSIALYKIYNLAKENPHLAKIQNSAKEHGFEIKTNVHLHDYPKGAYSITSSTKGETVFFWTRDSRVVQAEFWFD